MSTYHKILWLRISKYRTTIISQKVNAIMAYPLLTVWHLHNDWISKKLNWACAYIQSQSFDLFSMTAMTK